jgi:hypothetical protein
MILFPLSIHASIRYPGTSEGFCGFQAISIRYPQYPRYRLRSAETLGNPPRVPGYRTEERHQTGSDES